MSQTIEVTVPDIGDFKDVAIIEIFVKVGETVEAEQSLLTLETDKAAMEVPSPAAGIVKSVNVKLGDKVSKGSVIFTLESNAPATAKPTASTTPPTVSAPTQIPVAPVVAAPIQVPVTVAKDFPKGDIHAEVVVLGAGPADILPHSALPILASKSYLLRSTPTWVACV